MHNLSKNSKKTHTHTQKKNVSEDSLPIDIFGVKIDPTEWNVMDGFDSMGPMGTFFEDLRWVVKKTSYVHSTQLQKNFIFIFVLFCCDFA